MFDKSKALGIKAQSKPQPRVAVTPVSRVNGVEVVKNIFS